MNNIPPIEFKGQRVLTTAQLAKSFGSDARRISENFIRNKERYTEGKHYFALVGKDREDFLNHTQNADGLKNAVTIYLWTEKGAWMHAKSLNTDQAWEAYELLVDDYYRVKETSISVQQLSPQLQLFKQIWDGLAQKEIEDARRDQEIMKLQSGISTIKDTFLHRDEDWRKSINKMLNGVVKNSSDSYQNVKSESYKLLEKRACCDLAARVRNQKARLEEAGATKTKINNTSKLDMIEVDPRLKEIYTTIVKELSLGTIKI